MCYETEGLFRKLRAIQEMRKARREAETVRESAPREAQPAPAPATSRQPTRTEERPKVPA